MGLVANGNDGGLRVLVDRAFNWCYWATTERVPLLLMYGGGGLLVLLLVVVASLVLCNKRSSREKGK